MVILVLGKKGVHLFWFYKKNGANYYTIVLYQICIGSSNIFLNTPEKNVEGKYMVMLDCMF